MAFEGSIDLYHCHKRYGDLAVLSDVNLKISSGDFVVIGGASGSGKTSLLKLIWGEEKPTRGSVFVEGQDLSKLSSSRMQGLRRRMGIVFQKGLLLDDRTVFDNLDFVLKAFHVPLFKGRKRALQVLRLVGLGRKFRAKVLELSGGERQRLAVARALINGPTIILADEPTAHLDSAVSAEIMEIFSLISGRGLTLVVATHDAAEVDVPQARRYELLEGRLEPLESKKSRIP